MTDDIVTRLRDIASLRGNMSGSVIPVACTQAADEIERLRALLVHGLTEGYDCKGCDQCKQLKAIHLEAVQNGL